MSEYLKEVMFEETDDELIRDTETDAFLKENKMRQLRNKLPQWFQDGNRDS